MSEYDRTDAPGAVLGVIQNGELVFAKGYGMANLTHEVPITPETRFNIGSVSKQFTAFALALLAKQGKVSLDDPVSKYLPELPDFEEEVTLRHLLTHTSGYRETYGMAALAGRVPDEDRLRREGALEVVRRQPELEFSPGSKFQYNSSAYVLLSEIIERVTGEPFPEWMQENVFFPLGMENTMIEAELEQVILGAADSYQKTEEGNYRTAFSNRVYYGTADVYTTVGDLAKWLRNFQTAELGGKDVQERMRERFVLTSGDTTDYALGLDIDEYRGLRRVSHTGVHAAFTSVIVYYPELDAGVVVMRNDGLETVADKLTEIFFGEHLEPKEQRELIEPISVNEGVSVNPELLERYAGTYRAPNGVVFTWATEGGQLYGVSASGRRTPFVAVADSIFQLNESSWRVNFHPNPDGSVERVTLISHPERPVFRRIEPWHPSPAELQKYTGRYYNPEVETFYELVVEEGQLVGQHRWNNDVQFEPQEQDVFWGGDPFELVRFERGENGTITGFITSGERASNVRFERQKKN